MRLAVRLMLCVYTTVVVWLVVPVPVSLEACCIRRLTLRDCIFRARLCQSLDANQSETELEA